MEYAKQFNIHGHAVSRGDVALRLRKSALAMEGIAREVEEETGVDLYCHTTRQCLQELHTLMTQLLSYQSVRTPQEEQQCRTTH